MKVIELGRGLRGFQPEPQSVWEDSPLSMNRRRLRRFGVSEDMIERCMKYLKDRYGVAPDEREK